MFDENFFTTELQRHIRAKAVEGTDQPSLIVSFRSGQEYKVSRILEARPAWVVLEVYPLSGKAPRKHNAEDRKTGAPQYDLDRVAVPYGNINLVGVTLEPKSKGMGFHA
jgi:hypothetical protein